MHKRLRLVYWLCIAGFILPTVPWYFWLLYGPSDPLLQMAPVWYAMFLPSLYYLLQLHFAERTRWVLPLLGVALLCGVLLSLVFVVSAAITIALAVLSLSSFGCSRLWSYQVVYPDAAQRLALRFAVLSAGHVFLWALALIGPVILYLHYAVSGVPWLVCSVVLWLVTLVVCVCVVKASRSLRKAAGKQLQAMSTA